MEKEDAPASFSGKDNNGMTGDYIHQQQIARNDNNMRLMRFGDDKLQTDPVYFLKDHNYDYDLIMGDHDEEQEYLLEDGGDNINNKKKRKRKRARTMKTREEVESQRMTHIAVERNRRKQMNEHLRVLRSLMPASYVHRGDQASIIGGAIEFVRELEQLLQCLESQKHRRLYGESRQGVGDVALMQQAPILIPDLSSNDEQMMTTMEDETAAESKSSLADVEVKVVGFDAMIKILCRRRPGQLVNTIAGLEDLELNILHTNVTTIQQTVLYSFNVKVGREMRFTAEDIASSVQQMFSFIHTNSTI